MKTDSTATRTSKNRTPSPRRHLTWRSILAPLGLCGCLLAGLLTPACQAAPDSPILILVSLDGWRWDYLDRADTPRLKALADAGVRADGLVPSFPSKTFPNHYTIVTGLYPAHHGIVSNNMLDETIGERFSMSAPTAKDSRWWGGEPLWVTAEKQGQKAAAMFWPGSEAEIGGVRPSFWLPFQDDMPNRDRVNQVLDWLRLPEDERPSFLTLYFSTVDSIGHNNGPESQEVLEAAASLDAEIGALVDGVNALPDVASRVHYVIVSDHGMSQLSHDRVIVIDDYLDLSTVDMIDSSPVAGLWPRTGTADDIYTALKGKHAALAVYRRDEIPADLHYGDNPRIPPVIGIAADGWTISTRRQVERDEASGRPAGGNHGYDPAARSMHGLLIASGPQFAHGRTVGQIKNIHLYEMMAHVLGLRPAPNDGSLDATAEFWASR